MWVERAVSWFTDAANFLTFAQLIAAFVTAVATITLWRVTKVLAVETQTLAKMTSRPFVVCSLESSGASAVALNLTLRNTGTATAFDVRLELSPGLKGPSGTPSEKPNTRWDVSLLPPGQALNIRGVMGPDVNGEVFDASISWASMPGAGARETVSYRFSATDGFDAGWTTKGSHHIAGELEKLRKQLEKK